MSKFHRRRKKHQDVSDDVDASFLAASRQYDPDKTKDKGLWCKECRRRISWKELELHHELRSGSVMRVWTCPRCGNMVQTDDLTDMALAQELENEPHVWEVT